MEHYIKGRASVIIDGQFGSTGKGLLAAWIATHQPNEWVVHTTNAAPNAGHTTCWADGRKLTLFHLPTGGVLRRQPCYLNAGSIIDLELLEQELITARKFSGDSLPVTVHPNAAILLPEDMQYENRDNSAQTTIASTRKGVGRALARKVMREANVAIKFTDRLHQMGCGVGVPFFAFRDGLTPLSIEVPQGVGLSLNNSGFYPYCTSREISVAQALSDAFVHPSRLGHTVMSVRTYPIRVGNVEGGSSGHAYFGQGELDWRNLPVDQPELTTVTKRPRRIFAWSDGQYKHGLIACRPDMVFLNFVNYYHETAQLVAQIDRMERMEKEILGAVVPKIFGLGPNIEDVVVGLDNAHVALRNILNERAPS